MPVLLRAAAVTLVLAALGYQAPAAPSAAGRYEDLTALFTEWRAFQRPRKADGVPDYTPAAMQAQGRALPAWQQRLAAIDSPAWPIPQQADWHIVRAEMNGLEFDHRVLRPWANTPAFYVTVFGEESDQPARESHYADAAVELWSYAWPLSDAAIAEIDRGLRVVPRLLDQARGNLVGNQKDLWTFSVDEIRGQSADLTAFASRLTDARTAPIRTAAEEARAATDAFAAWVAAEAARKTGASGIGRENYDWYLANVELLPYTWQDAVTLMTRELARARASLVLEERRNAALPEQPAIGDAAMYDRRLDQAVTEYMAFLRSRDLLTVRDDMEPALRSHMSRFAPAPREFFTEINHRDPEVMRTHDFHWFDKARMAHDSHASPIRRGPLLYNIFISRTEGQATGWEEMMLHAGMLDARPRSRELIYILIAQRAARALGDLRMHGEHLPLEQAAAFTAANTPRGWLSLSGNLVRGEQFLYLRQPAYGISYLTGKIQIEQLVADRHRQLGDRFSFKAFMDEFTGAGLIPVSLIRWQLTGEKTPDLARVLGR